MATITKTTVEAKLGEYTYEARLDGNRVELLRDGALVGEGIWGGQTIDDFPRDVSEDARDALSAGIRANLQKAWRAPPEANDELPQDTGVRVDDGINQDAGNAGQMGAETGKPSRQGEKEVGTGGPGHDPNTGELGGQAMKPGRRAVGDGFRRPAAGEQRR